MMRVFEHKIRSQNFERVLDHRMPSEFDLY